MTHLPKTPSRTFEEINNAIQEAGIDISLEAVQSMSVIMYRTLLFNRSLIWGEHEQIFLVQTPQELIEIYQLRSTVFGQLEYGEEIPGDVEGLNFDNLDEYSAILYTKNSGEITGTCRVIFDNVLGLPVEKTHAFDREKLQGKQIAELSRLARLTDRGLKQDFKYLVLGVYKIMIDNDMDILASVMIPEHFVYYKNFGGFREVKKLESYIGMEVPFLVTSWEVSEISAYFKRLYLGIKKENPAPKGGCGFNDLAS